MLRTLIATGLTLSFLAACTEPIEPSYPNPEYFSLTTGPGIGMGAYNPEGWTSDEVRVFAGRQSCPMKVFASYEETAREDGFVDFIGLCPGGS